MMREIKQAAWKCDLCECEVFTAHYAPKGWTSLDEEQHTSYCPDCNPYLIRQKEPDAGKLAMIENKKRPMKFIGR